MVRFADNESQLKGRDVVKDEKTGLTKDYVNAMMYASRAPRWIQALGLRAMPLGLDLRGGLYLLYQVDVDGAVAQLLNTYDQDFRRALGTDEDRRSPTSARSRSIRTFRTACACCCRRAPIAPRCAPPSRRRSPTSPAATPTSPAAPAVDCVMTAQQVRERRDFAITSNITTLRNRVNELGVSEPIVQRQGLDRIVVQLPGVQNSAEVKDILGKVATLEYRLVDPRPHAARAAARRSAPSSTTAQATGSPGHAQARHHRHRRPAHQRHLDHRPERSAGRRHARQRRRRRDAQDHARQSRQAAWPWCSSSSAARPSRSNGKPVTRDIKEEKVISVATIQRRVQQPLPDHRPHAWRGARDSRCCCAAARWRRRSPSPTNASSARSSARRTSRRA